MATLAARPMKVREAWAFRSIWSKSLRAFRVPILAWGIGLALLLMATVAAAPSVSQAAGSLSQAAQTFSFFGEPVALGTPLGYITFKFLGLVPLFLGIWTVIAGAHLIRGDEERGSLDLVLGEPVGRMQVIVQKIIAFALGVTLIGLLILLGLLLGLASAKLPVDFGADVLAAVNISLTAFVYGALAIFFSQFTRTAGGAAGIAGAYMAVDFVVAGAVHTAQGPEWLSRLTINYYSELSKPIIPTYGANAGALLVMLGMSVVLVAASIWLFVRRDAGDVVKLLPQSNQSRAPVASAMSLARVRSDLSLSSVTTRALAASRVSIFWWVVGIGIYAFYGVSLAKAAESALASTLKSSSVVEKIFGGSNLATNIGFIQGIEFSFIPFVVTMAAMFFANTWASDLDRARLETTMAEPLPRWRVPLERFTTVVVGSVALGLVAWLAPLLGSAVTGFKLDSGPLANAGLGLIPLMLLTGALVYALSGILSSGVIIGLVGGLLSLSFIVELLHEILNLPDWALKLSIFHVYGLPMTNGINWTGSIVMLAVSVVLVAFATVRFVRSDLRN